MTADREIEAGFSIMAELAGDAFAAGARASGDSEAFCPELAALGARHAFAAHWSRPGLDRRSRSLVTLGILLAGRDSTELGYHVGIALNNGVTVQELEELVYHATVYAGFPAAVQAARTIKQELRTLGRI